MLEAQRLLLFFLLFLLHLLSFTYYVRREEEEKATGFHFSHGAHTMADMTVSVIERIKSSDPTYRKCRESHWIEQFEVLRKGVNKKR